MWLERLCFSTVRREEDEVTEVSHYVVPQRSIPVISEEHPEIKISLSNFCSLRPVNVLLSSAMPRDACLCQYHENIRMLCEYIA